MICGIVSSSVMCGIVRGGVMCGMVREWCDVWYG